MRTIQDVIGSRGNNFTVVRLVLSSAVIYAHSFGMTFNHSVSDLYLETFPSRFASLGGLAVDGFFFLSGMFVTQSFIKNFDLLEYMIRRIFRIIPGLFICLFVTSVLGALLCHPSDGWKYLLFSKTYKYIVLNTILDLHFAIPGIFDTLPQRTFINGSIHTLGLEMKMYLWLMVAGVVGLLSTRRRIIMNGIIVASLVAAYPMFFTVPLEAADYGREPVAMFALGVATLGAARHIVIRWWQFLPVLGSVLVTSGTLQTVLFFLAFAWAILFVGQSRILGRSELLQTDASYGIYIYGWPCTQIVAELDANLNPYLLALWGLGLAIALGLLSWRFIEKPWIDFGSIVISLYRKPDVIRDMWTARSIPAPIRQPLQIGGAVAASFAACLVAWPVAQAFPFGPRLTLQTGITNFGPQSTKAGEAFNIVPPGMSAMWFLTDRKPVPGFEVVIGNRRFEPTVGDTSTSVRVPSDVYDTPGSYPVFFEHRFFDHVERSNVMVFEVKRP